MFNWPLKPKGYVSVYRGEDKRKVGLCHRFVLCYLELKFVLYAHVHPHSFHDIILKVEMGISIQGSTLKPNSIADQKLSVGQYITWKLSFRQRISKVGVE